MISELNNMSSVDLHNLLLRYNWDDGFHFPREILSCDNCDLGTAIMAFHLAAGYAYLDDGMKMNYQDKEWYQFVDVLYHRVVNGEFNSRTICFSPDLTRTQKYLLKKKNPNIIDLILDGLE